MNPAALLISSGKAPVLLLFHGFLHIQHFYPDGFTSELNFQYISCLDLCGCFCRSVIDEDTACITGFIGYGTPLDQS